MVREISEDMTFKLISEKHEGTSHEKICGKSIPGRGNSLTCGSLACLREQCAWYTVNELTEAKIKWGQRTFMRLL